MTLPMMMCGMVLCVEQRPLDLAWMTAALLMCDRPVPLVQVLLYGPWGEGNRASGSGGCICFPQLDEILLTVRENRP